MCEFLIKAHNNSNARNFGSWRAGDVVLCMPDGWGWGAKERLPDFIVLSFPGIEVVDAGDLPSKLPDLPDPEGVQPLKDFSRRSMWRLDFADLHEAAVVSLLDRRALSQVGPDRNIRWSELRRAMKSKIGATMPTIPAMASFESQAARARRTDISGFDARLMEAHGNGSGRGPAGVIDTVGTVSDTPRLNRG